MSNSRSEQSNDTHDILRSQKSLQERFEEQSITLRLTRDSNAELQASHIFFYIITD